MNGQIEQGSVLLRGSEALALRKMGDRFTFRLKHTDSSQLLHQLLHQIAADFQVKSFRQLPCLQLVELQVLDQLEAAMQMARGHAAIAFASHVYQLEKSLGVPLYLTDQITLQFAPRITTAQMRSLAASAGLQIIKLVPRVSKCFVFRVMPQATANPLKIAQRLLTDPQVLLAEPNIAVPLPMHRPRESSSKHHISLDPATASQRAAAWKVTLGDRAIVVAVLDQQIDCNHPDLIGLGKIVAPWNIQPPSSRPAMSHGTIYARLAVAEQGVGIAPGCSLMPIETGDCLDDQSVETWFEWAWQQGAAVICCGWKTQLAYLPLSLRQRIAIAQAATQGRGGLGCVIVTEENGSDSVEDADIAPLNGFVWHPDGVVVAASDRPHPLNGSNLSVVAPGYMTEERAEEGAEGSAGAIVAGIAALMLSAHPNLSAAAVKEILQRTADKIADKITGASPPAIYDAAGHSQRFGYGQVNALKAVQSAQQRGLRPLVAQWLQFQNLAAIAIPDGALQGVTSVIQVEDDRQILDIEISVNLEHSFASDLELYLLAPHGETTLLQSRSLGRIGQINKSYSPETTPLLKRLIHQSAKGEWQLKLIDHIPLDLGHLQSWTLHLGV